MAIKINNSTIIDDSRNIVNAGIVSATSIGIGNTEVISSAFQLKNIVSLDDTTLSTIEGLILDTAGNLTSLKISGLSTFTNGPVLIGSGSTTGIESQKLQVTGDAYISGDINSTYTTYGSVTASTSTLSPVGIHSALPVATYRSVEYFIQATEGSKYQAVKLLSVHDGSTAYNTTYGDIFSNGSIASFDVDISGGNVRLVATASTTASVSYIVNYTTNKI